jgi:ADP-heptose:LPS heptosyltransferase
MKFEAALDMQGLLKSALPIAKCRAGRKVGYHWQREGSRFFSQAVKPDPSSLHIVDQYVDVARAIGFEVDRADFGLKPVTDDIRRMSDLLSESGVEGNFVLMNAGAGWATKRWPATSFASLIDRCGEMGWKTVLLGGKAAPDIDAAAEVSQNCKFLPANLLGKTSVRELVALTSLASAHVGGDTGSSHLAAALGIPAIGLYSITRPKRSCPYGQIENCHYDSRSLAEISVDAVFNTLGEALDA